VALKESFLVALILPSFALSGLDTHADAGRFDCVIARGRVIDPESKLDAVRDIGIKDGKIVAVSEEPLHGMEQVDAQGLIVSAGFIDLHSHAQTIAGMRMQAFDGVTTAVELEAGAWPTSLGYQVAARQGKPLNYGFSSSWAMARMTVTGGIKSDGTLATFNRGMAAPGWGRFATLQESERVLSLVEQGLREGGLGIGVLLGYGPESNIDEYFALARLAKRFAVPVFTHIRYAEPFGPRNSLLAHQELIALAAMTGAHMHICHLNSTASRRIPQMLDCVEGARARGLRITFEGYPYGGGSTVISAPFLAPENLENMGIKSSDIVYLKTGERPASNERLAQLRKEDPRGLVIAHFLDENRPADRKLIDRVILHPDAAIASDAVPWQIDGKTITDDVWPLPEAAVAHPRSAGCYARILGRYVREEKKLSLTEALRKCSLLPAQILEDSVPQMKNKGRIKAGADADIVVFDPQTVIDRATYLKPNQTSLGMRHVLVNGAFVIKNSELMKDSFPGKPVRRPSS
jgi:N-acyl-D-glutamate deacylase